MENIKQELKGDILTLTIDLSKRLRLSKSGKTTIIASTGPNHKIDGTDISFGLNVYEKVKGGEWLWKT